MSHRKEHTLQWIRPCVHQIRNRFGFKYVPALYWARLVYWNLWNAFKKCKPFWSSWLAQWHQARSIEHRKAFESPGQVPVDLSHSLLFTSGPRSQKGNQERKPWKTAWSQHGMSFPAKSSGAPDIRPPPPPAFRVSALPLAIGASRRFQRVRHRQPARVLLMTRRVLAV